MPKTYNARPERATYRRIEGAPVETVVCQRCGREFRTDQGRCSVCGGMLVPADRRKHGGEE